jgi:hypothetical protein
MLEGAHQQDYGHIFNIEVTQTELEVLSMMVRLKSIDLNLGWGVDEWIEDCEQLGRGLFFTSDLDKLAKKIERVLLAWEEKLI